MTSSRAIYNVSFKLDSHASKNEIEMRFQNIVFPLNLKIPHLNLKIYIYVEI